jgi:D-lysine oxidase
MQADSLVLGAGIVGVSVAIHLAQRGRAVVLVDRRQPGNETSFGNAGLIQREGVHPHAFPLEVRKLLNYSRNRSVDMSYHLEALPRLLPFLARYWWASWPQRYSRIAELYAPLIAHSISEHDALIRAAGAEDLIVKGGWFLLYRSEKARDAGFAEADQLARDFGVSSETLDGRQMAATEPALTAPLAGAVRWTAPWAIRDPHGLVSAYFRLFQQLGGSFIEADASPLEPGSAGGWRLKTQERNIEAREAVVALGPWSDTVTRRLGYRLPLAVKRGYHMHYAQPAQTPLTHWVLDAEPGYLLAPMVRGIRLTTGAEFAARDADPTPVQVDRAEGIARGLVPLGDRLDPEPWMGARPCTPDMMPIIGPAPSHQNLWFAFGHAHHGMTLGPATGRLLAEQMTGEAPFIAPEAFFARRFS